MSAADGGGCELPDITLTQLQPMVVMPESTDEIIDTLQLGVPHRSDVIIRDDPMMSPNPLNNATYKASLFELKNSTPMMYELVQIIPKEYAPTSVKKQQPTVTYVDLAPVQGSQDEQKTAEQFTDKKVKAEVKTEIKIQTSKKQIKQEKQEPHINKIKSRKGRRDQPEKVYEKPAILDDPEAERKRQNAISAKQNREKQKNRLAELETQVATLTRERDELKVSSEKYQRRSQIFEEQLRKVCNKFGVPIVIVTE